VCTGISKVINHTTFYPLQISMEVVFAPEPADRFDVVIQSSDGKLLHVHSTALMHHSKVFASIEDLGATKVIYVPSHV
jgi:hypothetical protein